jgi:hypothetical protein
MLITHFLAISREPRPSRTPQQRYERRKTQKNRPARGLTTLTTLITHLFVILRDRHRRELHNFSSQPLRKAGLRYWLASGLFVNRCSFASYSSLP